MERPLGLLHRRDDIAELDGAVGGIIPRGRVKEKILIVCHTNSDDMSVPSLVCLVDGQYTGPNSSKVRPQNDA